MRPWQGGAGSHRRWWVAIDEARYPCVAAIDGERRGEVRALLPEPLHEMADHMLPQDATRASSCLASCWRSPARISSIPNRYSSS